MDVILASASPRRKELLKKIFSDFRIIPADIDESVPNEIPVYQRPVIIAKYKAMHIWKIYSDSLVIGCDTAVIIDGEMLGKPKDRQDAERMLRLLSGRTHMVITGCCICYAKDKIDSFSSVTNVEFKKLSDKEIQVYLDKNQWQDKAGAYGIQDEAGSFVKDYMGDYYNVVGMPCGELKGRIDFLIKGEKY